MGGFKIARFECNISYIYYAHCNYYCKMHKRLKVKGRAYLSFIQRKESNFEHHLQTEYYQKINQRIDYF